MDELNALEGNGGTDRPIFRTCCCGTLIPILGTLTPILGTLIPILGTLTTILGTLIPILGTLTPILGTLIPILCTLIPILGTLTFGTWPLAAPNSRVACPLATPQATQRA